MRSLLLRLRFGALARGEVDFDAGAVRIEKEQLPEAGEMPARGQPPQIVVHASRFELGEIGRQIRSPEGHVVEHSGGVGNGFAFDDVQNGLAVVVEPGARERERRPRPRLEAELSR